MTGQLAAIIKHVKDEEEREGGGEFILPLYLSRILPTFPPKISTLTGRVRVCVFHCYNAVAITCEKAFDLKGLKGNLVHKKCGKGGMNG